MPPTIFLRNVTANNNVLFKYIREFNRLMVKKNYGEGSWFAVPAEGGDFVVGLAARSTTRGPIVLAYFFGERYRSLPDLSELKKVKASDAVQVAQVGDLGLIKGAWKVLGRCPDWDRSQWPVPKFVRREPNSKRIWLITYSDDDPSVVVSEQLVDEKEAIDQPMNILWGYKAMETRLSKLVKKKS